MPTISFVIPTFNFASFLPETLDSIVDEGYPNIEIIVFDGGSTDDTLVILQRYRDKFSDLKVVSATERGNIDIDLNLGVAQATGDYIWTLSADDVLTPGWSSAILVELVDRPDLLLVPAIHCDVHMRPRRNYPILAEDGGEPMRMIVANDDDLIDYLARVRTSEGVFSFCSACLVRRERLVNVAALEQANGTCWRYAARLVAILAGYPSSIVVMGKPLLYKRGENDSFSHAGPIRRMRIATQSWDDAIASLALSTRVSRALAKRAKSDIRPTSMLYMTQFIRDPEEQVIFDTCVRSRFGDGSRYERLIAKILCRFPRFALLKRGLLIARPMYRSLQRLVWEARSPSLREARKGPTIES